MLFFSLLRLTNAINSSTHLIKLKYIKPCFFIINSVNFSINDRNYHLTGCTHDSSVQMPSKRFTFLISDTHMKMRIIFSIESFDVYLQTKLSLIARVTAWLLAIPDTLFFQPAFPFSDYCLKRRKVQSATDRPKKS